MFYFYFLIIIVMTQYYDIRNIFWVDDFNWHHFVNALENISYGQYNFNSAHKMINICNLWNKAYSFPEIVHTTSPLLLRNRIPRGAVHYQNVETFRGFRCRTDNGIPARVSSLKLGEKFLNEWLTEFQGGISPMNRYI